jgi:hypothetical protein
MPALAGSGGAVPIRFPQSRWPAELMEEGPDDDPSILLSGSKEVGNALHRGLCGLPA